MPSPRRWMTATAACPGKNSSGWPRNSWRSSSPSSWRPLPPRQLVRNGRGLEDLRDRLGQRLGVDGHGASLLVRVDIAPDERFDVAVEDEADEFSLRVDDGRAGVAADDVGCQDEVHRRGEVEHSLLLLPAGRELEGLLVVEIGGAAVEAEEARLPRDDRPLGRVPLRGAVGEPERERRVGRNALAISLEAGGSELLGGARADGVDLVLFEFPDLPLRGVDLPREGDHRVR